MTFKTSTFRFVLAGSLALNLILMAAGTMHFVRHRHHGPACAGLGRHPAADTLGEDTRPSGPRPPGPQRDGPRGPHPEAGRRRNPPDAEEGGPERPAHARLLRQIVEAMGGPESPRVHTLLLKSRGDMKATRDSIASAQQALEQALTRDPYDSAALKKALEDVNAQRQAAQGHGQTLLLDLAAQLTPEERKRLAPGRRGQRPPPPPAPPER